MLRKILRFGFARAGEDCAGGDWYLVYAVDLGEAEVDGVYVGVDDGALYDALGLLWYVVVDEEVVVVEVVSSSSSSSSSSTVEWLACLSS